MRYARGMHFKRGRRKNARAGCRLCKPHKGNGAKASGPTGGRHPPGARRKLQPEDEI